MRPTLARRTRWLIGGLIVLGTHPARSSDGPAPAPPAARKAPKTITQHGETRVDDYFWLREKQDPDVIAYLKAENAYTDEVTEHLKPLQEALYREMLGRIMQTDLDVPHREGGYFYYSRTEKGFLNRTRSTIHCGPNHSR